MPVLPLFFRPIIMDSILPYGWKSFNLGSFSAMAYYEVKSDLAFDIKYTFFKVEARWKENHETGKLQYFGPT